MTISDAIASAISLLGYGRALVPSELDAADAALAEHGLRLAVVPVAAPPMQLSSAMLIEAAVRRAVDAGEPTVGLQARIGRLIGRDEAAVARSRRGVSELNQEARARLVAHLSDPTAHPLPPAGGPGAWQASEKDRAG